MAPIDIVVLAVIGIAFVAVCVRIHRKGTCADCAQGGVCTGQDVYKRQGMATARARTIRTRCVPTRSVITALRSTTCSRPTLCLRIALTARAPVGSPCALATVTVWS